jgi:hypothetical protein
MAPVLVLREASAAVASASTECSLQATRAASRSSLLETLSWRLRVCSYVHLAGESCFDAAGGG